MRLKDCGSSSSLTRPAHFFIASLLWLSLLTESMLAVGASELAPTRDNSQQLRDLKPNSHATQVIQAGSSKQTRPQPPELEAKPAPSEPTPPVASPSRFQPQPGPSGLNSFVPLYEGGLAYLSRADAQRSFLSTLQLQANLFVPFGGASNPMRGFFQLGTPQTNLSALTLQGAIGGLWLNKAQSVSVSGHIGGFFQQAEGPQFKLWPGVRFVYKDCEVSGGVQLPMKLGIYGAHLQVLLPAMILENSYLKLRWHREGSIATQRDEAFTSHWLQGGGVFHIWKDQLLFEVSVLRCLTALPSTYDINRTRIKVGLKYRYKQGAGRKVKLYNEPLEYPISLLIQNDLESSTGGGNPNPPGGSTEDPTDPGEGGENPTDPGEGEELTPPNVTMSIPGMPQGANSITNVPDTWIRGCGVQCVASVPPSQSADLVNWSVEPLSAGYFSSEQGSTAVFYRFAPAACKIKAGYPNAASETVLDFGAVSSDRFMTLAAQATTWSTTAATLDTDYFPPLEIVKEALSVFGDLKAYAPLKLTSDDEIRIFSYNQDGEPWCATLTETAPWFEESLLTEDQLGAVSGLCVMKASSIRIEEIKYGNPLDAESFPSSSQVSFFSIEEALESFKRNRFYTPIIFMYLRAFDHSGAYLPSALFSIESDKPFSIMLLGSEWVTTSANASPIKGKIKLGRAASSASADYEFNLPPLATYPWSYGWFLNDEFPVINLAKYKSVSWLPGFPTMEELIALSATQNSSTEKERTFLVRDSRVADDSETAYVVTVSASGTVKEDSLREVPISEMHLSVLSSPALQFSALTDEQKLKLARFIPAAKMIPESFELVDTDTFTWPVIYGMSAEEAMSTLPAAWIADMPCLVSFFDWINIDTLLENRKVNIEWLSVEFLPQFSLGISRAEVSCVNSEGQALLPFDSHTREVISDRLANLDVAEGGTSTEIAYLNSCILGDNGFTRNDLLSVTCQFKDSTGERLTYTFPALEEGKLLYVDSTEGCSLSSLPSSYQLSDLASSEDALEAVNFLGWPHFAPAFLNLDRELGFWVTPASATSLAEVQVLTLVSSTYSNFEVTVRAPSADEQAYPLTRRLIQGGAYTRSQETSFAPLALPKIIAEKISQRIERLKQPQIVPSNA